MMERQQILATMGELKLFGMKAAYDEIIKVAVKRTHEPQQIVGDLLQAEIRREAGALDPLPDDDRQAAPGQGHRRVRLQWHADQRDPDCATSPAASSWLPT